jgi:hypothetical protein
VANKKYIKREFSQDSLKGYSYNKTKGPGATVIPNFSFDLVLQLIENDPVARGALNHFVDKCMEGDYSIIKKETNVYDSDKELRLDENFMFRTKVLSKIFLAGKLYNNVFIEIVRDIDGKTIALNVLDSSNIDPITEPNGDPVRYVSKNPNPVTGIYPTWDKNDIVWVKFKDRTAGYAPVDMRALWDNLSMKQYIRRYVAWLWKTGQYRLLYGFKNAATQDIQDFITYAKANDEQFDIPFIVKGELETRILRDIKETQSITQLLKYLDEQTLILLRVPPIDAGIPEASGRSNADAQSNNIETAIVSFKRTVEDYINFDLFPKINMGTYLLKFAPTNRFAEQQLIGMAQVLVSMNVKDEVVQEFLFDKGFVFKQKKIFKDPQIDQVTSAFNRVKNPRDKDMAPSRLGKLPGESNTKQEEVTTREDQLHTNL